MSKISILSVLLFFVGIQQSKAQFIEIKGKVIADDDIDRIHVINKSSNKFTITDEHGDFTIPVKFNDTVIFSAITYKPKEIIIDKVTLRSKTLTVYLTELVNELDEVVVGKLLTGNLLSDIENSEIEYDINFFDLGIPGYTGKLATQNERRLKEATSGGGIVPLNLILNAISGRTKMLKNQIKLEKLDGCMDRIVANLSVTFFKYNELAENFRTDFFYYCSESPAFENICKLNNDINTLDFLQDKLTSYKNNLQIKN